MLTEESRLADFGFLRDNTYLNTAAEGLLPQVVHEALELYWEHKSMGMRGRDFHFPETERCREVAAELLEKEPGEVSFCSCSSEAYNLLASALNLQAGDEVVISDLDFPAGATPWLRWPGKPITKLWQNRDGVLELSDLEKLLGEKTRLVQVSYVSFLTGYRIPWAEFCDLVRRVAPNAVLSVDVTQAFGRLELKCLDADCLISSTYKWQLGSHGAGIVAVPKAGAERLTTHAGGWYNLANAFDADRFERAEPLPGAKSFSVGMPPFPAIYALRAGLEYLREAGVANIVAHADPLVARVHAGLKELGIKPMSPAQPGNSSGIVSFQHERDAEIQAALLEQKVHVMHQAGRIRISIHGYNQPEDVERFLEQLRAAVA
ncbi:MAG: aminotransferase class V-fold PLP-dependent enzyme [Limisphaerales bacterium]